MRYASSPRSSSFSRWLLAAVIFIAILTFTNKEVIGVGTPTVTSDTVSRTRNYQSEFEEINPQTQNPGRQPDTPGGIPEPATLILLGSGLGAAWMMRRRMNK